MNKKIWKKPNLIVLYRGKPEEAVLAGCKGGALDSTPAGGKDLCWQKITGKCNITRCSAIMPS